MTQIFLKSLTICLLMMFRPVFAQELWHESFNLPGKGIMGDENGRIQSDFNGISSWTLEYISIDLSDAGDYAKTVSTSGGRFEACDIDGEVVWLSEWINTAGYENVNIELTSAETGSGTNTGTKYMKVFYKVDDKPELPFATNGMNFGNWGSVKARQTGIKGSLLQIICYISTHYAVDKVILDDVRVWNERESLPGAGPGDVVINELMPDPYPPQGLPNVEYIELYNTRDYPVGIDNWELSINNVAKKLPNTVIDPDGYLLLCATGSLDSLLEYGTVSLVPGFQGLLNNGAVVEIVNGEGIVIDRIEYSITWYGNDQKSNGGWSLERIDPSRHCNQPANWKSSLHASGGTPGSRNSVFARNTDVSPPFVKWAVAVSEDEAEVVFSEPIEPVLLNDAANYFIPELGNPQKVKPVSGSQVLLYFLKPLLIDKLYSLNISNLADECGNPLIEKNWEIQWNNIEPGDLCISEILFNPYPGGDDYVEICNKSEKLIDLSRLVLANRNREKELNQVFNLTTERRVLYRGEYLALTRDTNLVFPWYSIQCPYCFLQMNRMPAFPNDEGIVVLMNDEMAVIDEMGYNEKMHSAFISDTEGVSLERISLSEPAYFKGNWISAAGNAGYGTPGYRNSQEGSGIQGKPHIEFEPEAFSPNYDGYNDEFIIRYVVAKPGYVTNIKIFDAHGRFIRHYIKNETLGTSGMFTWNGEDETGSLLPVGVYVVLVELFNSEGEVYRFKDGVVLTGRME